MTNRLKKILISVFVWFGLSANIVMAANSSQIGAQLEIKDTGVVSASPIYSSGLVYEDDEEEDDENEDQASDTDKADDADDINTDDGVIVISDLQINNELILVDGNKVEGEISINIDEQNTLSGQIDTPEAIIFFKIIDGKTITGSTQADKNGEWLWTIPADLPRGEVVIYIGASGDGSEIGIEDYYGINLSVNQILKPEDEVKDKPDKIIVGEIKKPQPSQQRDLAEIVKIITDFEILNEENIVEKGDELLFNFRINTRRADGLPEKVTFRLRDWLGNIIDEQTLPLEPTNNYQVSGSFAVNKEMTYGEYYLESLFVAKNHTIFDKLYFRVADKKVLPFIGRLNLDSTRNVYLFYTIFIGLFFLILFLLWQFFIFAKFKGGRVQGGDLKDDIK